MIYAVEFVMVLAYDIHVNREVLATGKSVVSDIWQSYVDLHMRSIK